MERPALFSHIQRNNMKTVALLALFLVLLVVSQIAILLVPMAMNANVMSRFQGVERSIKDTERQGRLSPKITREEIEARRGNASRDTRERPEKTTSGLHPIDSEMAAVPSPAATSDSGGPIGSPRKTGIPAVWQLLAEHKFLGRYWYLIIVGGLAYIALSCWRSVVLMRHETRAHPVERSEAPDLYNLVENLAISIGLPCPRIEVIETDNLNAYAAGFFPTKSTIAVTRGLIQSLTRDELEGVLAHELVHIRDRDVRLMVMAHACVDRILPVSRVALENLRRRPFLTGYMALLMLAYLGWGFAILFLLVFGVIAALTLGARFAISQTREFTADAGAVELTKKPAALITALRKVARADDLALTGYASRAMMFSSSDDSFLGRLIGTHPPIEARIAAIRLHGGVAEHELPPVREFPRAAPVEAPAQQPAFGRRRVIHGLSGGMPWSEPPVTARAATPCPLNLPTPSGGVATSFGRRTHGSAATTSDPGQRPIAPPPVKLGTARQEEQSSSVDDWLVGRKGDQITGGIEKAVKVPVTAMVYFSATLGAFALVMSLMMVSPSIGLTLACFLVWYAWRNVKRGFSWLRQSMRALAS